MENNQVPSQKVEVKTKTGIYVSVLMIGAFLTGMAILFMLPNIKTSTTPAESSNYTPPTPDAMAFVDVMSADISFNPPQSGEILDSGDINLQSVDESLLFGIFPQYGGGFDDGDTADEELPLAINVQAVTHPAMYITLQTTDVIIPPAQPVSKSNYRQPILGIPTADAQVIIPDKQVICIPEKNSNSVTHLPTERQIPEQNNPILGIKTTHAQVDLCTDGDINGCFLCVGGFWQYQYDWPGCEGGQNTYFIDEEGNSYYDANLTQRANETDCQDMVANNFDPILISNITSSKTVDLGLLTYLVFAKSWNHVLGFYNSAEGFIPHESDPVSHAAPLFVLGGNSSINEETKTLATMDLNVTTMDGIKKLCLPEQVLEPGDWFVVFYDNNGHPYTDMLLQNQIPCNANPNGCGGGVCPDGYWCRNNNECCHKVGGGIQCTPPGVNMEPATPSL
ncbi:hypothetical protein KKF61_05260 [Patescibacteria group bacterium]|nr:hypothetical protein [Patescibacteria group bacterium]MBU0963714.1 hypothetical protein [Patescibacteria group bacterium]